MIDALQSDARFAPVFRKRRPGDVSTEELRGFMDDLERLRLLEEEGEDDGGEGQGE